MLLRVPGQFYKLGRCTAKGAEAVSGASNSRTTVDPGHGRRRCCSRSKGMPRRSGFVTAAGTGTGRRALPTKRSW